MLPLYNSLSTTPSVPATSLIYGFWLLRQASYWPLMLRYPLEGLSQHRMMDSFSLPMRLGLNSRKMADYTKVAGCMAAVVKSRFALLGHRYLALAALRSVVHLASVAQLVAVGMAVGFLKSCMDLLLLAVVRRIFADLSAAVGRGVVASQSVAHTSATEWQVAVRMDLAAQKAVAADTKIVGSMKKVADMNRVVDMMIEVFLKILLLISSSSVDMNWSRSRVSHPQAWGRFACEKMNDDLTLFARHFLPADGFPDRQSGFHSLRFPQNAWADSDCPDNNPQVDARGAMLSHWKHLRQESRLHAVDRSNRYRKRIGRIPIPDTLATRVHTPLHPRYLAQALGSPLNAETCREHSL
ncbi:hypothetical protein FBEOM_4731 [Fusarium beomiforme]|uniref:Uncharacterized protein n=1 Tax=Fusarium beomiforme TaxID=44412 RepID=A0A9P5DXV8_9HYPO|nr:hypothetical protein FBEOM_4731 [Fusarium beomiforme]